jgi:dynein heavy chain
LFLYPIFNSAGIQEEVKNILDSDAFLKVDEAWREIMNELKNDTKVLNLGRIKDLEHILSSAHESLENIQKNLNEYLENKRKAFPRFYFLSNEDLIQILGDVQNPKKIQQHLKKCFEGIDRVTFHKRRTPDE